MYSVASAIAGFKCSGACRDEGESDPSAVREARIRGRRRRKAEGTDRKSLFGSKGDAKYLSKNGNMDPHYATGIVNH